jgi:hypothetical protein
LTKAVDLLIQSEKAWIGSSWVNLNICPKRFIKHYTLRRVRNQRPVHHQGFRVRRTTGNHPEMTGKQDLTQFVDPQTGATNMLAPSGKL